MVPIPIVALILLACLHVFNMDVSTVLTLMLIACLFWKDDEDEAG